MPEFTIETTYHEPVFRHRAYTAETLEAACRLAVEDEDWGIDNDDHDPSSEVYISGVWKGAGQEAFSNRVPVPSQFEESLQRRARHFEVLLGLLKILFEDAHAARPPSPDWLSKSAWAIARGDAILVGNADPIEPIDPRKPSHVLARLEEDKVRDAIKAVIDIDPGFAGFPIDQITDEDMHSACLNTVAILSLSDDVGNAEFRTAMTALQDVRARLQSN